MSRRLFFVASCLLMLSVAMPSAGADGRRTSDPRNLSASGALTGTYATIMYPHSRQTSVRYVGPSGSIAGQFQARNGSWHGFTRIHGAWRSVSVPMATKTFVSDIGPNGELLGGFVDAHASSHGFFEQGGRFTTITFPSSFATNVSSGNSLGDVAGTAWVGSHGEWDFVYHAGTFTSFAIPSTCPPIVSGTGIDDAGLIVGWEELCTGEGFAPEVAYEEQGGTYTTINDPKQSVPGGTYPLGISPHGEIVGSYTTAFTGTTFVSTPYVQIGTRFLDLPPGPGVASSTGTGLTGTVPLYANEWGVVVGYYTTASNTSRGFEFIPT